MQVTVEALAEQFQLVPVAETKLKPLGKLSVTVIGLLVGPAEGKFRTVRVYEPCLPTVKVAEPV